MIQIRPSSSQRQWDAFVGCDPAIIQPPKAPPDDASEEDRAAFKAAAEEYVTKIQSARETSKWDDVIVSGQQPTRFVLGFVDREDWRALADRNQLPSDNERYIGERLLLFLLTRMSLKAIAGAEKFERLPDPKWDNWVMAPADLVKDLDERYPSLVADLGYQVLARMRGPSPL